MRFRKLAITLAMITAAVTMAAGCSASPKSSTNSANDYQDEMRVALAAQPSTLDPLMVTGSPTKYVMRNVFETLITMNSEYEPVPMLAESIDTSEDGKTYVFNLRQGVTFHNGKEMTAADVVASMKQWLANDDVARDVLGKNAKFVETDKYTVTLQLEKPSIGTLGMMAIHKQFPAIMPKTVIEGAGTTGVKEFIGTGPFKFGEWKQDQYIHLTKYDDYKSLDTPADGQSGKKEALVKDLYFDIVTDPSTRLAGLQTGKYDIGDSMDPENYEQLKADPQLKTYPFLAGHLEFVYNRKAGIFKDQKMRDAVNTAINAEEIMQAAFGSEDLYELSSGYMSTSQKDWSTDAGDAGYNQNNPEKAKQLLKDAGYKGETVQLLTTRDDAYQYKGAVVVKEQLKDVGMKVALETVEWATYSAKLKDPTNYDFATYGMATVTDPGQLNILGSGRPGYTADPKITGLLAKMKASTSQKDAAKYWDQAQQVASEEFIPVTQAGEFKDIAVASTKVEGFTVQLGPILWNTRVLK